MSDEEKSQVITADSEPDVVRTDEGVSDEDSDETLQC